MPVVPEPILPRLLGLGGLALASWRKLGAPWGGTHASAPDLARFLGEFLGARRKVVKPETARLMIRNHNPEGFTPHGLGFGVGKGAGSAGCSDRTFGHTGSTGTLCWADPASETICVVLTSRPRRAAECHPRELAAERAATAARRWSLVAAHDLGPHSRWKGETSGARRGGFYGPPSFRPGVLAQRELEVCFWDVSVSKR